MTPDQISAAFRQARLTAKALDTYPGNSVPPDLETAYRIQDSGISAWPHPLCGWKVAMIAPSWRETYPAERLAGPVFAHHLWRAGDQPLQVPVIEGGYAAVEAEFAIRIGADIPASARFTEPAQLLPYVEGVYAAIELAGTPLAALNKLGPGAVASDFGNNTGLIIGAPLGDVLSRPADASTQARVNGEAVGSGSAVNVPGGPLAALLFLVENLASRGRSLRAGDWVSTGATTGIHPVRPGDRVEMTFNQECRIALEISAARPLA